VALQASKINDRPHFNKRPHPTEKEREREGERDRETRRIDNYLWREDSRKLAKTAETQGPAD
jgi:hypothetical protein